MSLFMRTALDSAQMLTIPTLTLAIKEAMRTQRAMHRLKPNPVDNVLAQRLIELALKVLTSLNVQTWEFVMVKDQQLKARLNRLAWAVYGCIGRRMMANNEILRLVNALK